ncbi:MAG: efflux RND transporter permease subunit [Pseudomonadota bacterium]|nr:efflux RND transporter permease subunit [Pseudomonadota bacterium]
MPENPKGIIETFALHPVAGNLLMMLLILFGLFGLANINRQVLPDIDIEIIKINVVWPGASPQDIEANVILAIEPEVRFIDGVKKVDAVAFEGTAEVSVTFEQGTDMSKALADVQSATARITTFPADIERPIINQVLERDNVSKLEISGPFTEQALKGYARQIRDDLLKKGLPSVNIIGARDSEIWVEVPDSALRELRLSLNDVASRVGQTSLDLPSGSIQSGGRSRQIRSEGLARNSNEVSEIEIISRDTGEKVLLKDVAVIKESFKENSISHLYKGSASIALQIKRGRGIDSIDAQNTVNEYLRQLRPTLPSSLRLDQYDVFSNVVRERIDMLLENGLGGLLLVLAALYLFLNARIAFWVAAGIPIAILSAIGGMYILGMSLNMISLFAVIMGLGIIVDDAIVVGERTETLHRRGMTAEEASIQGALTMKAPVIAASLTTLAAFFPLLMLGDTIGQIIGNVPLTICMIILFSLAECFLVLPMHLRGALKRMDADGGPRLGSFHKSFNQFRDKQFHAFMEHVYRLRYSTVTGAFCALILSIVLLFTGRVPFEFFPSPETDVVFANFSFSPGTPREKTEAMVLELERSAFEVEDRLTGGKRGLIVHAVGSIATSEGRTVATVAGGDHLGGIYIEFIASDQRDVRNRDFFAEWKKEVNPISGIESLVMFERSDGGPPGKDIDIRIFGNTLDEMKLAAIEIREVLRRIPGTVAIEDNLPWGKQEIVLGLTPEGRAKGFTTESVAQQVRNAFEGAIAKRFARDEEEVVVRVMLPKERARMSSIREFYVSPPEGRLTPITEAVNLQSRLGFAQIRREDGIRQVAVTADVDTDLNTSNEILALFQSDFAPEIMRRYDVQIDYKGKAEEQGAAFTDVRNAALVALVTMYIILAWVFSSYRTPFIVLSIIPFALIGALLGHYIMGLNMNMLSLQALVGLAGVMINDSIILVTAIQRLRRKGKEMREAIIEGTKDRLRPVCLTTITTVGGLTPLMFEGSMQAQFVQPMAATIVFGMLVSPFLVLMFVPALLGLGNDWRQSSKKQPKADAELVFE